MIEKRKMPKNKVRVTFTLPAPDGAEQLAVVGDFNEWNPTTHPMTRTADSWTTTVTLDAGQEYQFRYFDGQKWYDDDNPDKFAINQHGSRNAILDLTAEALPAPKKSTPKKTATTKKKA